MKYRVVFRERSNKMGEKADNPSSYLDTQLDDGVILDSVFVGRLEPTSNQAPCSTPQVAAGPEI